jgi:hypothetical protein
MDLQGAGRSPYAAGHALAAESGSNTRHGHALRVCVAFADPAARPRGDPRGRQPRLSLVQDRRQKLPRLVLVLLVTHFLIAL